MSTQRTITPELLVLARAPAERARLEAAARAAGMRVSFVGDTTEVMPRVLAHEPDVVVLPLDATEEESVLLCRALRRRLGENAPKLVLVAAGGALIESEEEALEVGADAFVDDFEGAQLWATLGRLLAPQVARTVNPDVDGASEIAAPDAVAAQLVALDQGASPLAYVALVEADIRDRFDAAHHADYFTLLGIGRDADDDAVREAYLEASARFEPARFAGTIHARAVEVIAEALADAWYVLGDKRLRRRYRSALRETSESEEP